MPKAPWQKQRQNTALQQPGGDKESDYVGVRLGAELRARAIYAAQALGMPLSTWIRMAISHALDYGLAGLSDQADPRYAGFVYGRQLGIALAQTQIQHAIKQTIDAMPLSFEEAEARFPNGEGIVY